MFQPEVETVLPTDFVSDSFSQDKTCTDLNGTARLKDFIIQLPL
jgi:hypothetical protein